MLEKCTIINTETNEIFYGQLDSELVGVEGYPYRAVTEDEITSQQGLKEQLDVNQNALDFLVNSDWKVLRHIGQKALGIETSLSDEEYFSLEIVRQSKRDSVSY